MSTPASQDTQGGPSPTGRPCLQGFQVLTWDWATSEYPPEPLDPSSLKFSVVTAAVHYALCIMEKDESLGALAKLGTSLCKSWVEEGTLEKAVSDPIAEDMKALVDYYVQRLRSSFYTVVLADLDDAEALTVPADPVHKAYHYPGAGNLAALDFEPKDTSLIVYSASSGHLTELERAYQEIGAKRDDMRENALRVFRSLILHMAMCICHEIAHGFALFIYCLHGRQEWGKEPVKTFYSPYSGLGPNEEHPRVPYPERAGEAGKVFEYFAWGGLGSVRAVDARDKDHEIELDDSFLGWQFVQRTNVEGVYKYRTWPYELAEKFFDAPEDFSLADFHGPLTDLVDGRPKDDSDEEFDQPADALTVLHEDYAHLFRNMQSWTIRDAEAIQTFVKDPLKLIPPPQ